MEVFILVVDIICIQRIDFFTDNGNNVKGVKVWYLSPDTNNDFIVGTLPKSKFLSLTFKDVFTSPGKYKFIADLNGKVSSVEKVN